MILLIDNYDSFTYNLVDYLLQLGVKVVVKKNDSSLDEISELNFKGIIISPGPETPEKSGITNTIIDKYHDSVPILGICLGFQALGVYFGGKLTKLVQPKHGKISKIKTKTHVMYQNIPEEIKVTRYHSLAIQNLPENLEKSSFSMDDKEIMSFHHKYLPIWGIQYHPEAVLTEYGINILRNWVTFNKLVQS